MSDASRFTFGSLTIEHDDRVLHPRGWTVAQAEWAAELSATAPSDLPVLELCTGAGQIGLLAARLSGRRLVAVDASPAACELAARNGLASGIDVSTRCSDVADAVADDERFAVVVADPPWVRSADVARWPEDPRVAIDGGVDGLAIARQCVVTAAGVLDAGASVVLQLGDVEQAAALVDDLPPYTVLSQTRVFGADGVLLRIDRI